jgi:hypothetical protein
MKHSLAYSDQIGGIYYRNVENSAVDANMAVDELPFARTAWMAIESGTAPEHMASDINEYVVEEVLWYVRTQILFGNRLLARKLLRRCQTSRYRMRKAWWAFWAMVPSRGTRFAVQIKSRIKGVLP